MIDTPGFDDTSRSDIDTLKTISSYLGASFANGVRIDGIVYLHRVSDNRLGGSSLKNLRMFKKLSGTRTWPNTIIGTTMWVTGQHEQGERREGELMSNHDYFGDMLSGGAKVFRIAEYGTGADEQRQSGLCIISHLIQAKRLLGIELEIQRELVLEGKTLNETSAGREALGDLYHLQRQLARQVQDAQKNMREALACQDVEQMQHFRALEEDCKRKVQESQAQQEKLKKSLLDMHDAEVENLQSRLDGMEFQYRAVLVEKRQELEDMEESLRHVREQSAVDAARWRKQYLDMAAVQKKRQADENLNQEYEQSLATMTDEVAQQEAQLRTVVKAKEAAQKKQQANEKIIRECEQSLRTIAHAVAQQETKLQTVMKAKDAVQTNLTSHKAKGGMRSNIASGIAQGVAGAAATAIGTAGETAPCVMHKVFGSKASNSFVAVLAGATCVVS